jgi:formamidopyrimidine-DNA glycosylase
VPELPDIVAYIEALEPKVLNQPIRDIRLSSPFLLRSVDPPLSDASGKSVTNLRRLGKRIVLGLEDDLFLVIHLMIAGRFHWKEKPAKPNRQTLASLVFPSGTLTLTEAGSKKRASMHFVRGESALAAHDPGGLEVLEADLQSFTTRLTRENHTLKRALTDPHLFSGIGNAYSDEILHAAGLSPLKLTARLDDVEVERLFEATVQRFRGRYLALDHAGKHPAVVLQKRFPGFDFPESVGFFPGEVLVEPGHTRDFVFVAGFHRVLKLGVEPAESIVLLRVSCNPSTARTNQQ